MFSKTSIAIIILMIFCYFCVYFFIADKVNFETKIDNTITKIQNNFFILQERNPKVFEDIVKELSPMNGRTVKYLIKRVERTALEESNEKNLSIMTFAEWYCLSKIGKRAIPYLIKSFEDKATPISMRWILVDLMEQVKDGRIIKPFIKSLSNKNEDIYVRIKVAFAMRSFHNQEVVKTLIKVLNDLDDDYTVRMRAATALGEIGSNAAVPYLIKTLPTCDINLRRFSIEALGKIGDKSATDSLIPFLSDEYGTVRSATAVALGKLKDIKAIPALKNALKDQDAFVRKDAMIALGRLGDEQGFQLLIDGLRLNYIEGNRWEIIKTLAEIRDKRAIEPLKEQLRIKRTGVGLLTTALTALSLAKLGDYDGFNEALECLESQDFQVKIVTIQALGEMRNKSAIDPLTRLLDGQHDIIKAEAEKALIKIKGTKE